MTALTALVLHHDSADTLGTVLDALAESTLTPARLLVLDNSADPVQRAAASALSAAAGAEHVVLPNRGYGAAMNAGLELVDTELAVLLTHETVLERTCLALLVDALASDAERVVVGPLLGRRERPEEVWSAGGVLHADWHVSHVVEPLSVEQWRTVPPHDVDWLDGAALLLRTGAVRAVGGFDERFFLYWEEVDLQRRLVRSGGRLSVVPEALAWQSAGSEWATAMMHRNKLLFVEKAGGRLTAVGVAVRDLLGDARRRRQARETRDRRRGTWAYARRTWGLLR